MAPEARSAAIEAQGAFSKADELLHAEKVPTFCVYTKTASEVQTDHEYQVKAIAIPSGYEVVDVYHRDWDGDGTVPAYSAMGSPPCRPLPVINCKHAFMCEDQAVLDWLAQAESETALTWKA